MTKFNDVYNTVVLEIKYRDVNSKNTYGLIPNSELDILNAKRMHLYF
jgi:hypothetical protein